MDVTLTIIGTIAAVVAILIAIHHIQAGRGGSAIALLNKADAAILESKLALDFHIHRLSALSDEKGIPTDVSLASLKTMRSQCDELKGMVDSTRSMVVSKGAAQSSLNAVDQWVGTILVMPRQIELGAQQIEQTLHNEPLRQGVFSSGVRNIKQ